MILPRRQFLTGLASLIAAPAIVKVSSLMPIKSLKPELYKLITLDDYLEHIMKPMVDKLNQQIIDGSGNFA